MASEKKRKKGGGDFSGGPVVKTPHFQCFHCRRHGFNPWSGNYDPTCHAEQPKKKKKKGP